MQTPAPVPVTDAHAGLAAEYRAWRLLQRREPDDIPAIAIVQDAEDLVRREILEHVVEHIAASIRRELSAPVSRDETGSAALGETDSSRQAR